MKNIQQQSYSEAIPFGCTSLRINDTKGNVYHGRTLEYSSDLPSSIIYYPADTVFDNKAPDFASQGLSYKAKYNILCIATPLNEEIDIPVEGINSAGLSGSLNMKTDSDLPALTPDQYPTSVAWALLMQWALANCASVADIKKQIKDINIWTESVLKIKASAHFIFYDTTGASLVVEIADNTLHVIDNPTGVLTNGPEFNWHLTNLNNYTHLTNRDSNKNQLGNLLLKQPDTGIATALLPSSNTSVGRFVRAVFYSTFARKEETARLSMLELSHIMNKFDRPKNITESDQGEGGETDGNDRVSEYTLWTTLTDLQSQEMYVRTYYNLNYEKYSITLFAKDAKKVVIPIIG